MARGTVKWFNKVKGYGFIHSDSGKDIYVHFSSIKGPGYRVLEQGEKVTFDPVHTPKGLQAFNVRKDGGE